LGEGQKTHGTLIIVGILLGGKLIIKDCDQKGGIAIECRARFDESIRKYA